MLQDIAPHCYDNAFRKAPPRTTDYLFSFDHGKALLLEREEDTPALPHFGDLPEGPDLMRDAIYLFSIDDSSFFLTPSSLAGTPGLCPVDIRSFLDVETDWPRFALVTASQLNRWYKGHRFCGRCGTELKPSELERAMVCPGCSLIEYPKISPVVMAAVTHEDRLLLTRYAGRLYNNYALIAGFVEVGETLEQAVHREVMEEVGLKIKNLTYFASQPWSLSDSLISGFFAELDGSPDITLDRSELAEAHWIPRSQLPHEVTSFSITASMVEHFRSLG